MARRTKKPVGKKRAAAKPSRARRRSPGERAAKIAKALAKRLGLTAEVEKKTKVRGKSALALIKGRKTLPQLGNSEPGIAIREALKGGKHAANIRVKVNGEWVSLSSLSRSPDRIGKSIPRRTREILAGKDSPKSKVINREASLRAPIITGLEVYVTKYTGRRPKKRTKAQLQKSATKALRKRGKKRGSK